MVEKYKKTLIQANRLSALSIPVSRTGIYSHSIINKILKPNNNRGLEIAASVNTMKNTIIKNSYKNIQQYLSKSNTQPIDTDITTETRLYTQYTTETSSALS